MLNENLKSLLLSQERGVFLPSNSFLALKKGRFWTTSMKPSQTLVNPSSHCPSYLSKSGISYIHGKESYFVYLTCKGSAALHSLPAASTYPLTKPGEKGLKLFVTGQSAYLALLKPRSSTLFLYQIPLAEASVGDIRRQRILKSTAYTATALLKVDPARARAVFKVNGSLFVWDLAEDWLVCSKDFQGGEEVWYSRGFIIKSEIVGEVVHMSVTDSDTGLTSCVRLLGIPQIFNVEVMDNLLVIASTSIYIIDLAEAQCLFLHKESVKFYVETEYFPDSFVLYSDGTGHFPKGGSIKCECKAPLFTDCDSCLVAWDAKQLKVITPEGVESIRVPFNKQVNCIGINEDTLEVYLGLANGQVLMLT